MRYFRLTNEVPGRSSPGRSLKVGGHRRPSSYVLSATKERLEERPEQVRERIKERTEQTEERHDEGNHGGEEMTVQREPVDRRLVQPAQDLVAAGVDGGHDDEAHGDDGQHATKRTSVLGLERIGRQHQEGDDQPGDEKLSVK